MNFLNVFIMCNTKGVVAALVGGAVLGAGIALLFAPEKGTVQRKRISDILSKYGIKLKKQDLNDLVEDLKESEYVDAPDA